MPIRLLFLGALLVAASSPVQGNCGASVVPGKEWLKVRHAPAGGNWHPATDDALGTEAYGNPSDDAQAWSIEYASKNPERIMFAKGNCESWMVMDPSVITTEKPTDATPASCPFGNQILQEWNILEWSRGALPNSPIKMVNRPDGCNQFEDPFISMENHAISTGALAVTYLYAENGFSYYKHDLQNVAMDVWVLVDPVDPPSSGPTPCPESNNDLDACWNDVYPTCTYVPGGKYACANSDGDKVVATCTEDGGQKCHALGFCDIMPSGSDYAEPFEHCCCPEGLIGTGYADADGCSRTGWSVRIVLKLAPGAATVGDKLEDWKAFRVKIAQILYDDTDAIPSSVGGPGTIPLYYLSSMFHEVSDGYVTIMALYAEKGDADAHAKNFNDDLADGLTIASNLLAANGMLTNSQGEATDALVTEEINAYAWSNVDGKILPTGMEVDNVFFETSCEESGCWVVDVTFTVGENGFNAFFLPDSSGSDTLSYDPVYSSDVLSTYEPRNFPCRSDDAANQGWNVKSACCLMDFVADYRPVKSFEAGFMAGLPFTCDDTSDGSPKFDVPSFGVAAPSVAYGASVLPASGLSGDFKGMDHSSVGTITLLDPYIGQYTARFYLDEVELRTKAGILKGTVGVEHTVDTFIGYANFKPTPTKILDAMATQAALHLEKTSFFSVSTHGVNDYTFLEYINLRLVTIYNQDTVNGETEDEQGTRTTRTDSTGAAQYVQVTFTLGEQYSPIETGLIPMDSVRVGKGVFFDDAPMFHTCLKYAEDKVKTFAEDDVSSLSSDGFADLLLQDCAPGALMCQSPASIPDQFVSVNLPLGVDWLPQPSSQLDANVFVSMVISAVDDDARGTANLPNSGQAPWQMKTTLTASIPVVAGGVNIFCDSVTAKTDLKDVANVDIVVGSAMDLNELSRLRILKDLATTQLSVTENTATIDSASIEAGLMTFVMKGNSSYFLQSASTSGFSLELEDVITIHIMEASTGTTVKADRVEELLGTDGQDNFMNNNLDTDGYAINGAFYFRITRPDGRAHLEPSADLLAACPFNPPRPTSGVATETCVIRRDVKDRVGQQRTGADFTTAMELPALTDQFATPGPVGCGVAGACRDAAADWLVSIFGDSAYTDTLARAYSHTIADYYKLNARFNRAYWINPGYEWTPTQTAGASLFTISQKIYLFALVTLDENWDRRRSMVPVAKRRMLLQSGLDAQPGAASSAAKFESQISRQSILAAAFNVPADQVVSYQVISQLTMEEACMDLSQLAGTLSETFADYLSRSASPSHSAQAVQLVRSLNGVQCPSSRRASRALLASFSAATVESTMMIVFKSASPKINMEKFSSMAGIAQVEAVDASAVTEDASFGDDPKDYKDAGSASSGDDEGSDDNTTIIIGAVCGAVGGVLVLAAGAFFIMRRRSEQDVAQIVAPVSREDLKAQLSEV